MNNPSSRERVMLAFAHRETDRVPVDFGAPPEGWARLKAHLRIEDNELRVSTLKTRLARAQQRLRRFVKPGRSLAKELIAERREAARHE